MKNNKVESYDPLKEKSLDDDQHLSFDNEEYKDLIQSDDNDKGKKQSTGSLNGHEEENNEFDERTGSLDNLIVPDDGLATIVTKQKSPIGKEQKKPLMPESAGDSTEYQIDKDDLKPKSQGTSFLPDIT